MNLFLASLYLDDLKGTPVSALDKVAELDVLFSGLAEKQPGILLISMGT